MSRAEFGREMRAVERENLRERLDAAEAKLEAQDRLIEQLGAAMNASGTAGIDQRYAALAALSTWKDGQMSDRPNARARG